MGSHVSAAAGSTRSVLDAVRRIVQALRESSRRAERQVGVSGAQLFVLHKLAESPGLSLTDLASRTHTHQSSVSTVVSRLVSVGLVRRAQTATDARRLTLTLSARGRRLVGRTTEPAQEGLIRSFERLAPPMRRQLAAGLTALVEGMAVAPSRPAMFFDDPTGRRLSAAGSRRPAASSRPAASTRSAGRV